MWFALLGVFLPTVIGLDLGESGTADSTFQIAWGGYDSAVASIHCGIQCLTTPECESFTIHEQSLEQCQLHNKQALTELATYNSSNLWVKPGEAVCGIYKEQCYMVVTDRLVSWYEARDFCEEKQAYLADMPDTTEGESVSKYAKGLGNHVVVAWIGVVQRSPSQRGTSRNYKWLRSDINVDNNAFLGRWVDRGATAACALLQPKDPNYKLHDDDCAKKFPGFICEW